MAFVYFISAHALLFYVLVTGKMVRVPRQGQDTARRGNIYYIYLNKFQKVDKNARLLEGEAADSFTKDTDRSKFLPHESLRQRACVESSR